jgi:hypothetical protein
VAGKDDRQNLGASGEPHHLRKSLPFAD